MKKLNTRLRMGFGLAAVLGLLFVALGLSLALGGNVQLPGPARAPWQHMFGVRDAFLGALVLTLIAAREIRALLLFSLVATLLPVVDTLVTAGDVGWARAAGANLPYELPLLLLVWLLWPRRQDEHA